MTGISLFEVALPDDDVGDAVLVLEGQEDDVALAGALAHQDEAGDGDPACRCARRASRSLGVTPARSRRGRRNETGWAFSDRPSER